MIQRIQTVYLSISVILLLIVTFGMTFFSFVTEQTIFRFNSYGISEIEKETNIFIKHSNYPFFIGTIALILLCVICILSYKNLQRQFKLGRTIFALYFLMLVTILLISAFGDSLLEIESASRKLDLGFFLFVAGFPFTFLANISIKRDKRLLDSLDRLR